MMRLSRLRLCSSQRQESQSTHDYQLHGPFQAQQMFFEKGTVFPDYTCTCTTFIHYCRHLRECDVLSRGRRAWMSRDLPPWKEKSAARQASNFAVACLHDLSSKPVFTAG